MVGADEDLTTDGRCELSEAVDARLHRRQRVLRAVDSQSRGSQPVEIGVGRVVDPCLQLRVALVGETEPSPLDHLPQRRVRLVGDHTSRRRKVGVCPDCVLQTTKQGSGSVQTDTSGGERVDLGPEERHRRAGVQDQVTSCSAMGRRAQCDPASFAVPKQPNGTSIHRRVRAQGLHRAPDVGR